MEVGGGGGLRTRKRGKEGGQKSHRKRADTNDEKRGVKGRGLRRLTASDKA